MDNRLKLRINTIFIIVYNLGGDIMNDIVNIINTVCFPITTNLIN